MLGLNGSDIHQRADLHKLNPGVCTIKVNGSDSDNILTRGKSVGGQKDLQLFRFCLHDRK